MNFDHKEELEKCKKVFNRHEFKTLVDQKGVTRFSFSRPDSGSYSFSLTCADNLIVMNGDCYSLLVEPGYGRNGLGFLLSNIDRDPFSYFLSKVPYGFKGALCNYSPELAKEHMQYYIKEGILTEEDLKDWYNSDEGGDYGEFKYYEFCHEKNIDELLDPDTLDHQVIVQIAGLQCFAEQYKKLNNIE